MATAGAVVLGCLALLLIFARPKCDRCGERTPNRFERPNGEKYCTKCYAAVRQPELEAEFQRTHHRQPGKRDLRRIENKVGNELRRPS